MLRWGAQRQLKVIPKFSIVKKATPSGANTSSCGSLRQREAEKNCAKTSEGDLKRAGNVSSPRNAHSCGSVCVMVAGRTSSEVAARARSLRARASYVSASATSAAPVTTTLLDISLHKPQRSVRGYTVC